MTANIFLRGGRIAQWLAYLLTDPAAQGLIHNVYKKNSKEKIVDVAGINHLCCLEKSGRWLENVDPTHLVLASVKLELKKHSPSLKIISIA